MELNNNNSYTEEKMQYILDENKNLVEIPTTDMVPVEYPIKCKLISAFEVFVRVPQTEIIAEIQIRINFPSINKGHVIIQFMKCYGLRRKLKEN